MRSKMVKLLIILALCGTISCKGFFTISGSEMLRQGTKYHVSITAQGYEGDLPVLEVAIRSSKKDEGAKVTEYVKNVTLINDETQRIEFDLKGQPKDNFNLEVKSLTGDKFEKNTKLHMNSKKHSVLVQTDKSMYKPADKVQFRVLALNADMKPLKKGRVQIYITDGAQNRVKQFDNVVFVKGVYGGELQLSDLPVMGTWKINVKVDDDEEVTKEFEVAEYTLPKFEVTLEADPDANLKDGKVRATLRAKYTFGKIAKGNATVTAEVDSGYRYWRHWQQEPAKKISKSFEVEGKKEVEFDIEELGIKELSWEKIVQLHATFKEELTEREQNATAKVTLHKTPHKVEIKSSSNEFKPGLPFSSTVIVQKHANDAPVTDDVHPVNLTVKYYYDTNRTCYRRRYHWERNRIEEDTTEVTETTIDSESEELNSTPVLPETTTALPEYTTHKIVKIAYECREEHSYEKNFEKFLRNGVIAFEIEIPDNTSRLDIHAKYMDTEASSNYIQKANSESNQFIETSLITKSPKLSEVIRIKVSSNTELDHLNYQVVGKGDVLVSETVKKQKSKEFQIEFQPTQAMVPRAQVVVFYMTEAGEIVSDKLTLEFENELNNFIDIELSKTQTQPSDDITISVFTKSNSFVGLLGVDKSVLLLKKGNDIERSNVFSELETYDRATDYNYEWSPSTTWTRHFDFQGADSVLITNAKDPYYPPYVPLYHPENEDGEQVYYSQHAVYDSAPASAFGAGMAGAPALESARPIQTTTVNRVAAMPAMSKVGSAGPSKPVVVRTEFPETWLFDSFDLDEKTSNITITKKVPDTITSWIITGFSVDPATGLGISKVPSKFTVFQPFFVTTNLPYSIKRGEVVSIPVLMFNYLDDDQNVDITLFNEDQEFEFVDVKEEKDQSSRPKREVELQRKKTLVAKSQSGTSVPFMIRPLKVGHIKIKITATSPVAGDGVQRQLLVEPEGVTQYMNKAVFIDLRATPDITTSFKIEIPQDAVPDSTRIEASAVGDILGPSIENLEKLIRLPYGCGEQNMLNFVPNIVVLDYLTTLGKLTPEIEARSKNYMETGYQRELGYKHDDGSYSAFGKSDKHGSTWLTAFVAKSFHQASKYIMVDQCKIKEALDFLAAVQAENGSFPEVGHVSHKDMQGGSSKGIALTAYTLITFLENKPLRETYQKTIDKALDYVVKNLESLDDNYSLAIASYALELAGHESKESVFAKLNEKSENKNGLKYWEKAVPKSDEKSPWSYTPNSVNVEMTAYAMQTFVEKGKETDAVPILKWMVTQRNENGGFQSTQDTVVGLQALSKLAAKIHVPSSKIDIVVKPNEGNPAKLELNDQNALILQKHELSPNARDFEVTARGRGFGVLQLAYRYNLDLNLQFPRFVLEPKLHENSNKEFLHLVVCTSFVPDDLADRSNMAVMEVSLPSGFTYDTDSLDELKMTDSVKKVELKEDDTIIIVYFDDVSAAKICPEFKAYRTHSVAKQKPAPVKIYDYYDNSRKARSFYNPPEISLCDICDGAEECKHDCETEEINIA